MTTVNVTESIAANAKSVWNILCDFGGIKVGGAIEAFETEGEGVGAVRTITMNGGKVIERLDILDEENLTFGYVITNEDCVLPVSNYAAKIVITADGDDSCTVDWTGTFEPKDADEETASNVVRGIYTGGIGRARSALT